MEKNKQLNEENLEEITGGNIDNNEKWTNLEIDKIANQNSVNNNEKDIKRGGAIYNVFDDMDNKK